MLPPLEGTSLGNERARTAPCIRQIRAALDDDADKFRYIETRRVCLRTQGGSDGCLRIVTGNISRAGGRGA